MYLARRPSFGPARQAISLIDLAADLMCALRSLAELKAEEEASYLRREAKGDTINLIIGTRLHFRLVEKVTAI